MTRTVRSTSPILGRVMDDDEGRSEWGEANSWEFEADTFTDSIEQLARVVRSNSVGPKALSTMQADLSALLGDVEDSIKFWENK